MSHERNQELDELGCRMNELLSGVPDAVRPWVAADYIANAGKGGNSLLDVYEATRDDVIIWVIGGTLLEEGVPNEQRVYYHLNRQLAERLVKEPLPNGKRGWSVITGMGPGRAMAGPHFCLKQVRNGDPNCASKCIAVPSGLEDETGHQFADEAYTVRAQLDNLLRELFMLVICDAVLAYPGFRGTRFEECLVDIVNYCAGRTDVSLPKKTLIRADLKNDTSGYSFDGGSFFAPSESRRRNSEILGVAKPGLFEEVVTVDATLPNAAGQIISLVRNALERSGRFRR